VIHFKIWDMTHSITWCKIMGLFYKRALSKRRYSAKETYNLPYSLTWRGSFRDMGHDSFDHVIKNESDVEWVMSHISMCRVADFSFVGHVTLSNASCHAYSNDSRHVFEWVVSHLCIPSESKWVRYRMSHVTYDIGNTFLYRILY